MGKKKQKEMDAMRPLFLKGARERGIPEKEAQKIFELMAQFAGYGFNKSHSAAYALIAYQTAYLKAHFPLQFMAALLTVEKEVTDNVVKYVAQCREMGIAVHPPDINRSGLDFTVEESALRFGLGAIKNVGDGTIEAILAARDRVGSFASLSGLCREVDGRSMNRKALESLIKCGALDGFGASRAQLMRSLDGCVASAHKEVRDQQAGQASLFGGARRPPRPCPRSRLKGTTGRRVSCSPSRRRRWGSISAVTLCSSTARPWRPSEASRPAVWLLRLRAAPYEWEGSSRP